MSNTLETKVNNNDGWKLIATAFAGFMTASKSCRYYFGSDAPDEDTTGHRLNTGDLECFVLESTESLYVKASSETTISYCSTGIGFADEWLRKKTLGLKAEPVQPYIELNCKLGTQWGINTYEPALETNGVRYLRVVTGVKPIALKGRIYGFDGLGIQVTTYKDPDLAGSTEITNDVVYNFNDRNPETLLAKMYSVTPAQVNDEGDSWIKTRTFLGDAQTGVNTKTKIEPDLSGLEIWFAENSEYLIKTESIDNADSQRYTLFATFYEGFPDVP